MNISKAFFAGSSRTTKDKPKRKLPELAFIGRSNVGKSSLINMLCNSNGLAKTSSTPGKTQLVNHFLINDSWYLVDLPGYGYAKVSKSGRESINRVINDYINKSAELISLFVLLDSRLPLQNIDLEFINSLGEHGIPFAIIFTKGDKSSTSVLAESVEKNKSALLEFWEELPPVFVSSAKSKMGREEILDYMEEILNNTKK